ncbi:hypothetical protein VPH35_028717 [Triticum aestivum]
MPVHCNGPPTPPICRLLADGKEGGYLFFAGKKNPLPPPPLSLSPLSPPLSLRPTPLSLSLPLVSPSPSREQLRRPNPASSGGIRRRLPHSRAPPDPASLDPAPMRRLASAHRCVPPPHQTPGAPPPRAAACTASRAATSPQARRPIAEASPPRRHGNRAPLRPARHRRSEAGREAGMGYRWAPGICAVVLLWLAATAAGDPDPDELERALPMPIYNNFRSAKVGFWIGFQERDRSRDTHMFVHLNSDATT